MEKNYTPKIIELDKEDYDLVMLLPPPNITGKLHIGHALTIAIEDLMVRYNRMKNKRTLYVPGIDHAGIATQIIVEKKLKIEEGKTRYDYGRTEFVKEIYKWKEEYEKYIENQLKRLNGLLDWERKYFTMDDNIIEGVKKSFGILYDKGYIYRDKRIVNFDCSLKSVISNVEIEKIIIEDPPKRINIPNYDNPISMGYMWYFRFYFQDKNKYIDIATTRPETMLGDEAFCVHPEDERYKELIGEKVYHPLIEKYIPIIGDEMVDKNFGTGIVKITPGHDIEDYECGKRHNLPCKNILTDDGKIIENGSKYSGMKRYDARIAIIDYMKSNGYLIKREKHKMVLSIGSRSGDIIEPIIKDQWYMRTKNLSEKIIERIDEVKIYPQNEKKNLIRWLENSQDWCISRQLWWGHRIPIYYDKNKKACYGNNMKEAEEKLLTKEIYQDEDVLDTWFSSALLPFTAFGWPEKEIKNYYPNTILETGNDILFFWVIRMMYMSLAIFDKMPFKKIYLHPMIRDKDGKKMSKSKGNVIDPLDVINGISQKDLIEKINKSIYLNTDEKKRSITNIKKEYPNGIKECGSDALKFTLLSYLHNTNTINLDIIRIHENRLFCNKIWNVHKLLLIKLYGKYEISKEELNKNILKLNNFFEKPKKMNKMDIWILLQLNKLINNVEKSIENYKIGEYINSMYNFIMQIFCGIYLETSKRYEESKYTIFYSLHTLYRLLHPSMPYLTEELFHKLPCQVLMMRYNVYQLDFPKELEISEELDIESKKIELEFDTVYKKILDIRSKNNKIKLDENLYKKYEDQIIDLTGGI